MMIRIFIGTEPKTELSRRVLEFSIRRRTTAATHVIPMIGPDWEYDCKGIKVGTGFSLRRWMIPAYCGWAGRAIYLDADQLVLGNIEELWSQPDTNPKPGGAVWCTNQPDRHNKTAVWNTSVMVIDCEAAWGKKGWKVDYLLDHLRKHRNLATYTAIMRGQMAGPLTAIPAVWNHLDHNVPGKTRLLHYTKEDAQPWYNPKHPWRTLWEDELQLALLSGYVTQEELRTHLEAWGQKAERGKCGLHPHYKKYLKEKTK